MGYASGIYKKALDIKKEYTKKQKYIYEQALAAAYSGMPRLSQIDVELSKIGASAAVKALSGDVNAINVLKEKSLSLSAEKQELLKSAGVSDYVPLCPVCGDTGYCKTTLCECVRSIAKQFLRDELASQMPLDKSTFQSFSLDFYPNTPDADGNVPLKRMKSIYDFAKSYAENFSLSSESLLFLGGAGLGKTHLSLAIGSAVLDKGFGVIYSTAQNILSKLEKEYFSHEGSSYIDTILDSDLVIIDDLGTEFSTQFSQSSIYNIINTRLLKNLPTIISTNLSFAEIEERYTARIASRLAGSYTVKKFLGKDIRIVKAMKQM